MKPIVRRALGLALILTCATTLIVSSRLGEKERRGRTCQGKGKLDVTVVDSLERRFVSRQDISQWLEKDYRAYAGLPLDSVDLSRIESIVLQHSAVRDCQAWLTDDGVLHVEISQREPVVRFDDGTNGWYADAEGFIFPLQSRDQAKVPVISGTLPLKVSPGFKGLPEDPAQRQWLLQMVALIKQMKGTVWEKDIDQIRVNRQGELVMKPVQGKEEFLFGPPVRTAEKFALMEQYYRSIAPSQPEGRYKLVDVRYKGQVICK